MMIKVYGHPMSTCTRKVLTTLAETKTPFELVLVDFAKGEHKQPTHLGRQPFGQLPAIDDDGFALYESRAICRYLSAKSGDPLVPKEPQQRGLMDQWVSVEQSNFTPAAMKFIFEYVFKRPQQPGALEEATAMLDKSFAVLSAPLAKSSFLVGEQFTLADIGYMPYFDYALNTPAKATFEKYPHVMKWWERISKRPSWLAATGRA